MRIATLCVVAAILMCALTPRPAGAVYLALERLVGWPDTDYVASFRFKSGGQEMNGTVTVAGKRYRYDMVQGRVRGAVLLDLDRQLAWFLYPADKVYKNADFAEMVRQNPLYSTTASVKVTKLGETWMDGREVDRLFGRFDDPEGKNAEIHMWVTDQNIVLRSEVVEHSSSGNTRLTSMTLGDLEVGPVNPSRFEIPPDYAEAAPDYDPRPSE